MNPFPPQPVIREHTIDAIVVIPGIMGSALKDSHNRLVWGFDNPTAYVRMWGPGQAMTPLALTPAELDDIQNGRYDPNSARLKPAGLIRFSAFSPLTGGFEPYTTLVARLKEVAAHPNAVLEFDYDWRLPTRLNSHLLAAAMRDHLRRWRAHPEHERARGIHPERRPAGIIIVAHSMGGLVARGLVNTMDGWQDVRKVITLGTPFYGSVKAAVILDWGGGSPVPLPRKRLREVARTMPGVYDLLPRNRCLLTRRDGVDDVVNLTAADIANVGACRALAEAAAEDSGLTPISPMPGHRAVVGVAQPTWQSLHIHNGAVEPASVSYRWDADDELIRDQIARPVPYDDRGDGTVWRYSARLLGQDDAIPVAQQHGALSMSGETIKQVLGMVTDLGDLGVTLGEGELGLEIPDTAVVDEPITLKVTGETDPGVVECKIVDLGTGEPVRHPLLHSDGQGGLTETISLGREGLYRVGVKTCAADWVTQIMLVTRSEG